MMRERKREGEKERERERERKIEKSYAVAIDFHKKLIVEKSL